MPELTRYGFLYCGTLPGIILAPEHPDAEDKEDRMSIFDNVPKAGVTIRTEDHPVRTAILTILELGNCADVRSKARYNDAIDVLCKYRFSKNTRETCYSELRFGRHISDKWLTMKMRDLEGQVIET